MALYQVNNKQQTLARIDPVQPTKAKVNERKDLQPLIRHQPECLGEDILIIAEEFSNWEDSQRRIDLLGLDRDGNLVVIELKREDGGGHIELQAVRYAAMVSAMNFEQILATYEAFLAKQGKEPADARQRLRDFLGLSDESEASITRTPRCILFSPSFNTEITTAVLWLNEMSLDIRCMEYKFYNLDGSMYLDVRQVIPLPSAADYMVRLRRKNAEEQRKRQSEQTERRERTMVTLLNHGVIQGGTRLRLIRPPRPGLTLTDQNAYTATYLGEGRIRWDYDGKEYQTLSRLMKRMCEEFGGDLGSGAFAGPDYWTIEGESLSLSQRAKQVLEQQITGAGTPPLPRPVASAAPATITAASVGGGSPNGSAS